MHGTALSMAGMTDTDLFVVSLPLSLQGHSIKAKEKLFLTLFVLTVVDFDSFNRSNETCPENNVFQNW